MKKVKVLREELERMRQLMGMNGSLYQKPIMGEGAPPPPSPKGPPGGKGPASKPPSPPSPPASPPSPSPSPEGE